MKFCAVLFGLLLLTAPAFAFEPSQYVGKQAINCGVDPHLALQDNCREIVEKRLRVSAEVYCANLGGISARLGNVKKTVRIVKVLGPATHADRPATERTILVGEIEAHCLSREAIQVESGL